ncbi:DDE superfamily endonuclease [Fragilaria crotonensis]|nr:DDE superfamily endonuclease [Fragilaria crotonensis]
MVLQIIFGMTGTPVGMYLRFGRRILIEVLKAEPRAAIKHLNDPHLQEAIRQKPPALDGVWCCMDGLKLYLQQAGNSNTQNRFYNGRTHNLYVTSVFVFCPDGTISICCYNLPGSIHDSLVAEWGNVYPKFEKVYDTVSGRCTVDSALSFQQYPFFTNRVSNILSPIVTESFLNKQLQINKEATATRQSAEWGMRAIQSSFPHLKDRFTYEENGELILKMMVLLYNLCAQKVNINQIRNTYMPALNINANRACM